MLTSSALEHAPIECSNTFVLTQDRGTEHDSDVINTFYGVLTVSVTGYYHSGQSYFYSVHHYISIDVNWPYWFATYYTWYSDQYDIDKYKSVTVDWSDSYDYTTTPYTHMAETSARIEVYWLSQHLATYNLDAIIYAPAK